MRTLTLKRVNNSQWGCFGVLLDWLDRPVCVTLERPWLDNQPNVSAIPAGLYLCKRIISPKFGEVFEVTGVPDRSHILFHSANYYEQLEGCIAIGRNFTTMNIGDMPMPGVQFSKGAFHEFMNLNHGVDNFMLRVVNCFS